MSSMQRTLRFAFSSIFLAALAACGGGGGSDKEAPTGSAVISSGQTGNRVPVTALDLGANAQLADGNVHVLVGNTVVVDASSSSDADGDKLTFKWQLLTKPDSSNANIISNGAKSYFTPDVKGKYEFAVTVDDGRGGVVSQVVNLLADNSLPVAATVITVDPQATNKTISRNATLNSLITLDASTSTDPDLDLLTTSWALIDKPTGSALSQTSGMGTSYRFLADQLGTYRFKATTTDTKGASVVTEITVNVNNRAPEGLMTIYAAPTATKSTSSFVTSAGYEVALNGGPSTDADGDPLTYQWQLISKPQTSQASVTSNNAATLGFIPDVIGAYQLKLIVTDAKGAQGENLLTLTVNNRRPVASISSNATPIAQASAPTSRIPSGSEITLRGSNSYDADGDALTYSWTIVGRPSGSTAGLTAYDKADVKFTPDLDGIYKFALRVTDGAGAYSERAIEVVVGGAPPVVVLDRTRAMATLGETVTVTATTNLAQTGSATYKWSLDTKPQASKVELTSSTTEKLSFSPDVEGTYIASVTVSDGKLSATNSVIVVAEKDWAGILNLAFKPDDAVYNRQQDIVVMTTSSPAAIKVLDPISNSTTSIALPKAISSFAVSPDGTHAVVAHDALISYIDLKKGVLERSVQISANPSAVFVTNDGIAYMAGSYTGGQWINQPPVVDMVSGKILSDVGYTQMLYSGPKGIYADRKNKFFYQSVGLSPADIDYQTFDPVTHKYTASGDSPYHGDYSTGSSMWLNEEQTVLFTNVGTMFNVDNLTYAGTNSDFSGASSMSQSVTAGELLVVVNSYEQDPNSYYSYMTVLQPGYRRFVGPYFSRVEDGKLPLVGGKQSYALKVFHTSAGHPVLLTQVGSNVPGAAAATYHIVYR